MVKVKKQAKQIGLIIILACFILLVIYFITSLKNHVENIIPSPNVRVVDLESIKLKEQIGEKYCIFRGGLKGVYINTKNPTDYLIICKEDIRVIESEEYER